MARPKQNPPSHFGDLVAVAIKRGMQQFGLSGRALARRLAKSPDYVQKRLDGKFEFTLADVEAFALFIGMNPEDFIGAIDRKVLAQEIPVRPSTPIEAVSLGELIAGGRPAPQAVDEAADRLFGSASKPTRTEKQVAQLPDLLLSEKDPAGELIEGPFAGLPQEEVSDELARRLAFLGRWVGVKIPDVPMTSAQLEQLAKAAGVPASYLLDLEFTDDVDLFEAQIELEATMREYGVKRMAGRTVGPVTAASLRAKARIVRGENTRDV